MRLHLVATSTSMFGAMAECLLREGVRSWFIDDSVGVCCSRGSIDGEGACWDILCANDGGGDNVGESARLMSTGKARN